MENSGVFLATLLLTLLGADAASRLWRRCMDRRAQLSAGAPAYGLFGPYRFRGILRRSGEAAEGA
ncbi:MAG TPA: hypothetical protein VE650_10380 [Acetobacteraceae bacterium]|nr:hypothetical protein [Acetobacteraceae bacterium]